MIARVALIAAITSEAFAVYTVAEWFAAGYEDGAHQAISAVAFSAVGLVSFFVPRFLDSFELRSRPSMVIMGIVAYVTIYGLLRVHFAGDFAIWDLSWVVDFVRDPGATMEGNGPVVVGATLVIFLWARAAYRSANDVELDQLPKAVAFPFILVTFVVVLSVYTERAGEVSRAAAGYYLVAVIALALGQLSLSGASFGDIRAGGTVAMLLGATAGLVFGAVVLFWLVFGFLGPLIGPPLETALFWVLTIVLTPVAWLLDTVFTFLLSRAGLDDIQFPEPPPLVEGDEQQEAAEPNPVERGGIYLTRILVLGGAIGLIALAVIWFTRLRSRARRPALDGDPTSLGHMFQEDLRGLANSLFRRKGAQKPGPGSTAARRLYLEVLDKAAATGVARDPDATPVEIAPRLANVFDRTVTDEITAAFVQSRYAGREPDAKLVAELERRWRLT